MARDGQVLANGIHLERFVQGRDVAWDAWREEECLGTFVVGSSGAFDCPRVLGYAQPGSPFQEWVDMLKALTVAEIEAYIETL